MRHTIFKCKIRGEGQRNEVSGFMSSSRRVGGDIKGKGSYCSYRLSLLVDDDEMRQNCRYGADISIKCFCDIFGEVILLL